MLAGPDAVDNLRYVNAMQAASTINKVTGRIGVAEEYEQRAEKIMGIIEEHCWDENIGMYKQGPGIDEYSQHTQVFAVLTGLAKGEKAKRIMRNTMDNNDIPLCSLVMSNFLFRALEKSGLYGEYAERLLKPWKKMLQKNLTTTPEFPELEDGDYTRSDCHAWSSLPIYEFTRKVLGVNPASPGWEGILIQPEPLSLPSAKGKVITPKGLVSVEWERADGKFNIRFEAPADIPVTLKLTDGTEKHYANGGNGNVSCDDINF